ncbi:hypothetical protein [Uliginosibacterium sediminicola]|uniref:5-carboxymethyl-2-hydroxymuconate isomerase n=1 Tax=Uliginosibacterium sediminicola TaxID=2024550 RepID=A0ABU9YT03_9RHOO
MPHLTLEYTQNLAGVLDVTGALRAVNAALLATGIIDAPEQLKSRAVPLDSFLVGNFETGEAFIHLRMQLMAGRSFAQRQQLGKAAVAAVAEALKAPPGLRVQITFEAGEMLADTYQKLIITH